MNDRDTFAAAALTGLLAAPTDKDRSSEYWARFSYEIADAMLAVRDSRTANEPVAWWLRGTEYDTGCDYEYVSLVRESADAAAKEGGTVTPLYRSPTLTDEERDAVKLATDFLEDEFYGCSDKCAAEHNAADTLRKLLERLK